MDDGQLLALEAEAMLRGQVLEENICGFLYAQLVPLIAWCGEHNADPHESVVLPTAQLLRIIADRLENDLADLI